MIMKDSLGDRMKKFYEDRSRTYLIRRMPVIIRIDGNAFHSLTRKGFDRPFDLHLMSWMVDSAKRFAEELPGFKIGYIQSDEVSFFISDFDSLSTEAWFDYAVQKIASISASKMTGYFNARARNTPMGAAKMDGRIAAFDCRCWNLPMEEVANYFLWRAQDWARNSLSMLTRAHYSHDQLHKQSKASMHEMLHKKGVNWAHLPNTLKNGTFIYRRPLLRANATRNVMIEDGDVLPDFSSIDTLIKKLMEPQPDDDKKKAKSKNKSKVQG